MIPTASKGASDLTSVGTASISFLKSLDFLNKTEETAFQRSASGGIVTIIAVILLCGLAYNEISIWVKPSVDSNLSVDISRGERMRIHLDITFHALPCSSLSLDALDSTGEQQNGVTHQIFKVRIKSDGKPIIHQRQDKLGSKEAVPFRPPSYCGSCFGAEDHQGQCCNSCDELKAAFLRSGRPVQLAEAAEQCKGESNQLFPDEGCNVKGFLEVNKVKGEFHVAAGSSVSQEHMDHSHHLHRFSINDLEHFNVSHTIHSVTFGSDFPGRVNPLNGVSYVQKSQLSTVSYFLKVVSTDYQTAGGTLISSCQYSVTESEKPVELSSFQFQLPGAFFKYEPSPLRIAYTETRRGLSHLLVRLCAVIGCVYVVLGIIHKGLLPLIQLVSSPASSSS